MSLVRELGRKSELVPADSLASTPHLCPFCLVRKKHRRPRWPWDTLFVPTDFSLVDTLEPGSPIPGTSRWGWQAAEWRAARERVHLGGKADAPSTQAHARGTPQQHMPAVGSRAHRFPPPVPAL